MKVQDLTVSVTKPKTRRAYLIGASLFALLSLMSLMSPERVMACGGFFCNAQDPVNQAAERILFSIQNDQTEMHVQIQYQGPPTGFGWIIPVTPGVTTTLSSEALFVALDRLYNPIFSLSYDSGETCFQNEDFAPENRGGTALDQGVSDPVVQVISREPVGPYDRAILQADNVEVLRGWLDENEFQIPDVIDETLQPYIDAGAVFVVIKLLADRDVGDLVPLKLTFPGTQPSIPVVPTAVAAEPDMGMIVHILGAHRAIPTNYRHVEINEAVIDWQARGRNYSDVVSQAADEAGGRAFVTDYAGEVGEQIVNVISPYSGEVLGELAAATTFGEIEQAGLDTTNPDYQRIFSEIFGDTDQAWDTPADGLTLSTRLQDELNPIYEELNQLFFSAGKLTRLYTTMSPSEMTFDPTFAFNPDLEDVSRVHTATLHMTCDDDGEITQQRLELSDGRSFSIDAVTPTARQDGETIRGGEFSAALRVEQLSVAGPPEMIMLMTPAQTTPSDTTASVGSSSDKGCEQPNSSRLGARGLSGVLLMLLGLFIVMQRRRVA